MLCEWEVPKKRKICLFKSYYMPILMYGAETWAWTIHDVTHAVCSCSLVVIHEGQLNGDIVNV
jgi:hypothetical protein